MKHDLKVFLISALLSNLLVAESIQNDIERQEIFGEYENILNYKFQIENCGSTHKTNVDALFFDYARREYIEKNRLSRSIFSELKDPVLSPRLCANGIREMTAYMLVAPKTSSAVVVYRGISSVAREQCQKSDASLDLFSSGEAPLNCIFSRFEQPRSFVSTSLNRLVARYKFKGSDSFRIHLPKGFPFYAMPDQNYESEILLPTHILNKQGKLIPLEFEIEKAWSYTNSEHNAYVKNAMAWNPQKESLDHYQARYAQLACSQLLMKGAYIERLCSVASSYYQHAL